MVSCDFDQQLCAIDPARPCPCRYFHSFLACKLYNTEQHSNSISYIWRRNICHCRHSELQNFHNFFSCTNTGRVEWLLLKVVDLFHLCCCFMACDWCDRVNVYSVQQSKWLLSLHYYPSIDAECHLSNVLNVFCSDGLCFGLSALGGLSSHY